MSDTESTNKIIEITFTDNAEFERQMKGYIQDSYKKYLPTKIYIGKDKAYLYKEEEFEEEGFNKVIEHFSYEDASWWDDPWPGNPLEDRSFMYYVNQLGIAIADLPETAHDNEENSF